MRTITKYRFTLAIVLFITSLNITYACLNGETMVLKNGMLLYEDAQTNVPYGHDFYSYDLDIENIRELDSLYRATNDLDYLSDKGVILIIFNKYKEAIDLYLEIEKMQPGRYATASNIGTAYELMGDNENALKWIKRAVEIDSTSHYNSEWIHVKILEAKIKGETYITTQHLLNADFGDDEFPTSELTKKELGVLSLALYYQLNERISFIKSNDKIVAQLLFDLGNIAYLSGHYEDALEDYRLAEKYGYNGKLIEQRIALVQDPLRRGPADADHSPKQNKLFVLIGSAGLLLAVLFVGVYIHKRNS
ncbi:MAG TPA: hypothetical protein VIN08_08575 [Ohtaekwangia sp.]|uniref:hypothetical protein n=1 Tax=Ohtaekwangia sp. TaxID=2066019 RepID=UPI002F94F35B